ncbi:hypothetical protein ES703_09899 [subsurface metagenome]
MFLKPIEKYKEYQDCLKEIEKQRVRCENLTKVFEEFEKVSLNLDNTLGIDKSGQIPDFESISKSKEKTKIAKREMDIANEKLHSLEEYLKDTIEKIRKLKLQDAQKIGVRISRNIVKAINMLCKSREEYELLNSEMKTHFGEIVNKEGFKEKGFSSVIGPDCRFMLNKPLFYSGFLRIQKEYQKKVKDI